MLIHLRGRVRAGCWDELVAFLQEALPFYEAPGGIRVRLLRDDHDPDAFIETVEYDSHAGYERDQLRVESDATMHDHLARWRSLLTGSVEVRVYRDVTPEVVEGVIR